MIRFSSTGAGGIALGDDLDRIDIGTGVDLETKNGRKNAEAIRAKGHLPLAKVHPSSC